MAARPRGLSELAEEFDVPGGWQTLVRWNPELAGKDPRELPASRLWVIDPAQVRPPPTEHPKPPPGQHRKPPPTQHPKPPPGQHRKPPPGQEHHLPPVLGQGSSPWVTVYTLGILTGLFLALVGYLVWRVRVQLVSGLYRVSVVGAHHVLVSGRYRVGQVRRAGRAKWLSALGMVRTRLAELRDHLVELRGRLALRIAWNLPTRPGWRRVALEVGTVAGYGFGAGLEVAGEGPAAHVLAAIVIVTASVAAARAVWSSRQPRAENG